MIKPSELVIFMRDNRTYSDPETKLMPIWSVDYGVNFPVDMEKSQLPLPCFYVDINTTSATVESDGEYLQLFNSNIRIRMLCRSQEDRLGKTGAEVAYYARLELFKILLFKKIDTRYNEIYFLRDDFEFLDEARYVHTFDFFFTGKLDPSTLTMPEFDELNEIRIDYNLSEGDSDEWPDAQDILDTLQD